jgi:hypothetical protein
MPPLACAYMLEQQEGTDHDEQEEGQMNHSPAAPEGDDRSEVTQNTPLANPRRTRLGPDGRPVVGPVSTTGD